MEREMVLATANPDKVREISAILSDLKLLARPADVPDVEETGETLIENARLKAVALCAATGKSALADDTGLEVDALDGAPGVYSSRFAGENVTYEDNVKLLLQRLSGVEFAQRTARFRTVALLANPDGTETIAQGCVEGHICEVAKGNEGFGYDPVFVPTEGDGRTFAEMSLEEKAAISHRGRAFRALASKL